MHSPDSNGGRLPQRKISDIFLSEGMVTQEQLDEACEFQKTDDRPIGKVLISLGYLTYEDLALALAKCLNMEYSTLTEAEVDPEVLGIVNEEALLKHKAVPVRLENGRLVVAMSDPEDVYARSDIAISAGYPITPVIAAEDVVQRLQDQLFNRDKNSTSTVGAEHASETGGSRVADNSLQRIEPGSRSPRSTLEGR